jgi:uncharacterized membrane protein
MNWTVAETEYSSKKRVQNMSRSGKSFLPTKQYWMIPMMYVGVSLVAALTLPVFEQAYLASYAHGVSVAYAQALLSATASGMMALTGIIFSLGFVMVQFSATAYSPRLVIWLVRDPLLFHSLGVFIATFTYAIAAVARIDRGGSGKVPFFSIMIVVVLLIASTMLCARLIQRLSDLQISHVLQYIGKRGREVIRENFPLFDATGDEGIDNSRSGAEDVRYSKLATLSRPHKKSLAPQKER